MGQRIDRIELTHDLMYKLGETLAELHNLSEAYKPLSLDHKRPDFCEKLNWIKNVIEEDKTLNNSDHTEALDLLGHLSLELNKLPRNNQNYGLIHYDYDLDNLFYDETTKCVSVIDFDDALYHWYYLDILNFYENLEDEFEGGALVDSKKAFNNGYLSKRKIDQEIIEHSDLLKKYSQLVTYAVCLYSSRDILSDPPKWMLDLKLKLQSNVNSKRNIFKTWLE